MKPGRISLIFAIGTFFPSLGWCFPELVRHGYVNCTSCHISPSGGGVLTQYGRELSKEILSTWGTKSETESQFAYGIVKTPEWLDALGLYRGVYAYQNTPFIQQGQYIFMQADLEAAAHVNKWYLDAALGYENKTADTSIPDHLISRRHFLNYRPTDELSFRAGRFLPNFGINTADHIIPTKRNLGWDEGLETYNLEAAWIGEKYGLFVTGDLGRPDKPSYHREQGIAITPSIAIADTYKVGGSYFYGNSQDSTRSVGGPWGILGFSHSVFLLTEWDIQHNSSKTGAFQTQTGMVNYQRLDYEMIQGLHVYLTQDFSQLDFHDPRSLSNSYGLGTQWFPRPHFEFNLSWQKLRTLSVTEGYTDFAWFMFNIYL